MQTVPLGSFNSRCRCSGTSHTSMGKWIGFCGVPDTKHGSLGFNLDTFGYAFLKSQSLLRRGSCGAGAWEL